MSTPQSRNKDPDPDKTRRSLRLWILAAVAFAAAILTGNGIMIWMASQDYPGSVVHNYFENYQGFNEFQDKLAKQTELDWRVRTRLTDLPIMGEPVQVQVQVRGAMGSKLSGARVRLHFVSGDDAREDQRLRLREVEKGLYRGRVRFPSPGNWEVITRVERGGDAYRVKRRLWVEEPLG
jgi:nitrogen fixation protein FixH